VVTTFEPSSVENVKSASEAPEVFKETNEQKAERRSEDNPEHERTDRRLEVEQLTQAIMAKDMALSVHRRRSYVGTNMIPVVAWTVLAGTTTCVVQ
jgi:hypothetical protein